MAGAAVLGSRAIIGEFYATLERTASPAWVNALAFMVDSTQESEEYKWLGMAPMLREWNNGRKVVGLRADGLTVINRPYEATLEVQVPELRRDQTGQIMVRVRELAVRARQHDAKILSDVIAANPICYDGQNFFDTDHVTDASGTQSNSIAFDISDSGIANAGTPTLPSSTVIARAMTAGVAQMLSFVDDTGEPMNETARSFICMVGPGLMGPALAAANLATLALGESNIVASNSLFSIVPVVNPRLTSWTASMALFRADGETKPLILQTEEAITMEAVAEGSEEEFKNNRHLYGVKRTVAAAPGYWQQACKVTLQA